MHSDLNPGGPTAGRTAVTETVRGVCASADACVGERVRGEKAGVQARGVCAGAMLVRGRHAGPAGVCANGARRTGVGVCAHMRERGLCVFGEWACARPRVQVWELT